MKILQARYYNVKLLFEFCFHLKNGNEIKIIPLGQLTNWNFRETLSFRIKILFNKRKTKQTNIFP